MKNHTIICGFGRNGKQAAIELDDHNEQFVIIEKNPEVVEKIRDFKNFAYIQGDATNDVVLEEAKIFEAKALVTTMPADADNLFVVLSAREMESHPENNKTGNRITIISRASQDHSDKKLKLAGADNVIMPDKIGGKRMAKLVVQPDVVEFIDYLMLQSDKDVTIAEITCHNLANCFVDKSIRELNFKSISGAYIIGIKTSNNDYIVNPPAAFILSKSDKLFVLGTLSQIIELKEALFKGK
jgi:voltage-gated potassium channel